MRFKKKQKISLSLCTTYDFSEYDEIKIHSIEVQLNFQELFKSQFGTFLLVASCREQDVLELYIYVSMAIMLRLICKIHHSHKSYRFNNNPTC